MNYKYTTTIFTLILILINIGFAQKETDQVGVLLQQGENFLEEYEFEKAVAAADQALQNIQSAKRKSPKQFASVYLLYGKIYEKGLYLDKAIEAYTNALKFSPKEKEIYERRGDIYQYIGETKKADADYNKAVQIPSTIGRTLVGDITVGASRRSSMDIPENFQIFPFTEPTRYFPIFIIKDWDNDLKISDEDIRKSYTSQLSKLNKLVKFNPQSDLALWKRGNLFLQMNEFSNQLFWVSAVSDFLDAYDLDPKFEYLNNVGVVRTKRDNKTNYEFAVKYFTDAIQINNKSYEVFYNRGLAYLKLNEYEKAIADFTEVIELNPNFLSAYKSRAKAFRAIGKTVEAEADEQKLESLIK